MFKTTPRSVLLGGDLLRKSAMRLRINDDGTLARHTDTLTEEDLVDPQTGKGGVPDPHGGDWMVDRAPTGSGPNHRHMIDALLHAMLRLSAKNGFEPNDELKNYYIKIIDHAIGSRNGKVREIEGENSPNILSGFRSKRWRTNHGTDYISEKDARGRLLPTVKNSKHHGGVKIQNADGSISDAGHQVSFFTKKGSIDDPNADQGNSIDSIFNPINVEIGETLDQAAPWIKGKLGIPDGQMGPLDNFQTDNSIKRFIRSHVLPLSEVSEGRVHALNEGEMNKLGRGIMPQSVLRRYKDHTGQGYVPAEEHASEYNVTHSGAPIPKYALEAHSQEGSPKGEDSYDRLAAMQQFLQSIVGDKEKNIPGKFPHMSPESIAVAEDLLAREETEGALSANVLSPKMSALFGIGTRRGKDKDTRTAVSNKVKGGVDNRYFQDYIAQLKLTEQEVKAALMSMSVENPTKDITGSSASDVGHAFHAAHLAMINKLRNEGHPEPHVESANRIKNVGQLANPGQARQVEDAQKLVDLYNEAGGHQVSYQGGNQMQGKNMDWFYLDQQDTNPSGALASRYGGMDLNLNEIRQSFETLQSMSAIKDDRVMKHVKKGYSINSHNDIRSFSMSVGITTQDVHGIMATQGDWNVVAKQWNVSPIIVKATKVTFGGV